MTSLAAWIAVDSRVISSSYLVSDSRISFYARPPFDEAQKLFASTKFPDLFGYCGQVDFPSNALRRALEVIDDGRLFSNGDDSNTRHTKFVKFIKELFETSSSKAPFTILHSSRYGEGMDASFFL